MWYEILPSFGIIVVGMALPHAVGYVSNKLVLGNYYRRSLLNDNEKRHYMRDFRLTGNPYELKGLESLSNK